MAAIRSRRLESLFGTLIQDLATPHVQSLVTNEVQEEFDLDFKTTLYGRGDSEKRDLAGDVAAMANTAGGVIILGVEEDSQATAIAAPGVDLSDDEKRRMTQVIASLVAPVPSFEVLPVPNDGNPEHGYYVIAVPRSPVAPHAVLVNQGLRYPRRNGSTTRYLSEPEVADAYRDRFAGAAARVDRASEIANEAGTRLHRDDTGWLMVTLVPDVAGSLEITHSVQQRFNQEIIGSEVRDVVRSGTTFQRTSVGRRRLLADGGHDGAVAKWASAELHTDGAGAYSLAQYRFDVRPSLHDDTAGIEVINDEQLVLAILTGLMRLAAHATDRAAAGGNALVQARIVPTIQNRQVVIGHSRRYGGTRGRPIAPVDIYPAETSASIDELASAGPELVAVAARIADQIGQTFGIAELGQLTRDGEIRIWYWNRELQQLVRQWADAGGIEISESTFDD